jgi:hypothetical protein
MLAVLPYLGMKESQLPNPQRIYYPQHPNRKTCLTVAMAPCRTPTSMTKLYEHDELATPLTKGYMVGSLPHLQREGWQAAG